MRSKTQAAQAVLKGSARCSICKIAIDAHSCLTSKSIQQMGSCQFDCFKMSSEFLLSSILQIFIIPTMHLEAAHACLYFPYVFSNTGWCTSHLDKCLQPALCFWQGLEDPLSEKRIIWVNQAYSDGKRRYPIIAPIGPFIFCLHSGGNRSMWRNKPNRSVQQFAVPDKSYKLHRNWLVLHEWLSCTFSFL